VYVSWSSSSTYGGDSGNRIFVLYWRCSLIRVSVIRGSTVITFPPKSSCIRWQQSGEDSCCTFLTTTASSNGSVLPTFRQITPIPSSLFVAYPHHTGKSSRETFTATYHTTLPRLTRYVTPCNLVEWYPFIWILSPSLCYKSDFTLPTVAV
jgi:hypothetical protein